MNNLQITTKKLYLKTYYIQKTIIIIFLAIFFILINSLFSFALNNVSLTIFDSTNETIPTLNETIITHQQSYFYANYTNDTLPISINSSCNISFNDSGVFDLNQMQYDNSLELFVYNRSFLIAEEYYYNISCNSSINESFKSKNNTIIILADEIAPLKITSGTDNITHNSFIFFISSDKLSNATFKYGTTDNNLNNILNSTEFQLNHFFIVTDLLNNTQYYFNVTLCNTDNYCAEYGAPYTQTTNQTPDTNPPIITFNSPLISNNTLFNDWKNILLSITTNKVSNCFIDSHKISSSESTTNINLITSNYLTHTKYFNVTQDSTTDNNYYFEINCTRIDNNVSAIKRAYFKVNDTTLPTISFTSSTISNNAKTNVQIQNIYVQVYETMNSGYPKLKLNTGTDNTMLINHSSLLIYKYTTSQLSEGEYNITATAMDLKGNLKTLTRTFYVDLTLPKMYINYPIQNTEIKNSIGLNINISLNEEGSCEYELGYVQQERLDNCNNRCSNLYDRCNSRADTTAEKTECKNEEKECKDDCEEEKFLRVTYGIITENYNLEKCFDNCELNEQNCNIDCRNKRQTCISNTNTLRNKCYDDYDICVEDCAFDLELCENYCDNNDFILYKDFDRDFEDGDYRFLLSCSDIAGNEVKDNITFSLKDITPPKIISSYPNKTIKSNTIQLSINTDKDAQCKFSDSKKSYLDLDYEFVSVQKYHTYNLKNLENKNYTYYVLCKDKKNNTMIDHYEINFLVELETITTPIKQDNDVINLLISEIVQNQEKILQINNAEVSLNEIVIVLNNNKTNFGLLLKKEEPSTIITKPTNSIYEFFSLTKQNFTNDEIEYIEIKFKVKKSWINSNNIDIDKIVLEKFENNWNKIGTLKINEDNEFVYFKSEVNELSSFAITGEKKQTQIPSTINNQTQNNIPKKTNNTDIPLDIIEEEKNYLWLIILILCVVVVGGGSVAFFVFNSGKHPQHDQNVTLAKQHSHTEEVVDTTSSLSSQNKFVFDYNAIPIEDNDELAKYIINAKEYGMSNEEIKNSLIDVGHSIDVVIDKMIYLQIENNNIKINQNVNSNQEITKTNDLEFEKYKQSIIDYISTELSNKNTIENIKQILIDNGNDFVFIDEIIKNNFSQINVQNQDNKNDNTNVNSNQNNNSKLSPQLKEYIEQCLREKMSKYHIKALLKKSNYSKEDIKLVMGELDDIKKNLK
jgi:PGF-pre-PGF domain-containing protein